MRCARPPGYPNKSTGSDGHPSKRVPALSSKVININKWVFFLQERGPLRAHYYKHRYGKPLAFFSVFLPSQYQPEQDSCDLCARTPSSTVGQLTVSWLTDKQSKKKHGTLSGYPVAPCGYPGYPVAPWHKIVEWLSWVSWVSAEGAKGMRLAPL